MLGLILPRPIGLMLLLVKPQMGIAVAIFWLIEAWREGRLRGTIKLVAPTGIVLTFSVVAYGFWFLKMQEYLQYQNTTVNLSFFPMSVPVGVALLVHAVRTRDVRFALPASPLFSPMVMPQVWSIAILALASAPLEMLAAVGSLWMIVFWLRGANGA